jgi:DNA replication initiation complex subunit (GINS family)
MFMWRYCSENNIVKKPQKKVPLALTEAERKLIVEDLEYVEDNYASVIRATPADQPVRFTLDDWKGLGDWIAAEVSHARDKRLKRELDRLYAKILNFLEADKPPTKLKIYRSGDE